ncbi:MAG: hypothetical protein BAJATHORv1_30043 [Candidatus Thorarchaeota archaeon]|nr:MAG: hypothetical protein BAJATHORv1_30043 [Candidatus Thorarchaeota archaeon]
MVDVVPSRTVSITWSDTVLPDWSDTSMVKFQMPLEKSYKRRVTAV